MSLLHSVSNGKLGDENVVVLTAQDGSRVAIPVDAVNEVFVQSLAIANASWRANSQKVGNWSRAVFTRAVGFQFGSTDDGRVLLRCHLSGAAGAELDLSIDRSDALGLAATLKETAEQLAQPAPSSH